MRSILNPLKDKELSPVSGDWFAAGIAACGVLTLFRVLFLWFDQTDLFVDESQYWLWGQDLDFGYYSKPPLIAWIIRLFTDVAGSDAVFWVRLPAAIFHFATAFILGTLARYLFDARIAFWVMISYITMPAVTLGSAVISTDTIMAPFFSLALLFYFRLLKEKSAIYAALAGLAAGLAFLAKYAGIYFILGVVLAAVFIPAARPSWRHALTMLVVFVVVAMPNIIWNVLNDLSTFEHTLDNANWVRQDASQFSLKYLKLAEFFFSQFGVFGPILFGSLLVSIFRARHTDARILLFFSVPVVAIVCVQALLSKAYANWAVAAYFGGTVLVIAGLIEERYFRLLRLSVWIGIVMAVGLPVITVMAKHVSVDGEKPAMKRLLGREDISLQAFEIAKENDVDIVMSGTRDIVADLLYTGRASGFDIRTVNPRGRPQNYYQLKFPLGGDLAGRKILRIEPGWKLAKCGVDEIEPIAMLKTDGGFQHGNVVSAFVLDGRCFNEAK